MPKLHPDCLVWLPVPSLFISFQKTRDNLFHVFDGRTEEDRDSMDIRRNPESSALFRPLMKRFSCNPVTQIVSAPSGTFSEQALSPPGGDESIPHFQSSPSAKLYWNSAMAPEGVFMQAMSLFIDLSSVMQGTYSAPPTCGCEHDV